MITRLARMLKSLGLNDHSLEDLGELYHDFSVFGYTNRQKGGHFPLNQKSKSPIISAYIQWAIAKSKNHVDDEVSFAGLFCADGYYAMLARHFGATSAACTMWKTHLKLLPNLMNWRKST